MQSRPIRSQWPRTIMAASSMQCGSNRYADASRCGDRQIILSFDVNITQYLCHSRWRKSLAMKWNDRIGRRLKLHDLHVLLTVAELGSMGKAAERLAVSQPSVSKAIADMEHTIGVRLLDRTPKGVETTAYGRALLRRSMGAFDELRQGIKDIESLADPTVGEVRVGCPEAMATGLMLASIAKFSDQYPRVVIRVTAANNMAHEFRLLRDRVVDFLVGSLPQPSSRTTLRPRSCTSTGPTSCAVASTGWRG